MISQVYGGGGNTGAQYQNDFIELYNPTGSDISLTGWSVQYGSTGGTTWTNQTNLTGSIPAGGYYLIRQGAGAGNGVALPPHNASGNILMSATAGKVALVNNTTALTGTGCPLAASVVDFVGYGPATNCAEGTPTTPNLSNTTAALRKGNGATDTDNNSADFVNGAPNPRTSAGINLSINDVSLTEGNSGTTSLDFTVSLSGSAGAGGVTFDIATSDNTATTSDNDYVANALTGQTIPAGSSTYTFSVLANGDANEEPNETFFVNVTNVVGATVTDGQGLGTILNDDTNFCTGAYTPISQIQGSGPSAAVTGAVGTKGVVVGDYEGASPTLRGFYLQDANPDSDPNTSEGIFVFNGSNNSVSVGDVVHVNGTATEFQDQTQINATAITPCGTGSVPAVDVTLPLASATALERFEGMLVRFPQTLYVTEHFQLGRFGQVLMSSGGVLQQPTNVVAPGALALLMQAANNLNKIIVDDDLQNQNRDPIVFGRGGSPLSASNTLRTGDTATDMVGVMTYTWGGNASSPNAYRLRPQNSLGGGVPTFQPTNARPASPPAVGGNVRVAALNLLNYFNTFDGLPDTVDNCMGGAGGAAMDCRGADTQTEFDRQWPKTVAAITGLDADVIGIMEIENDGYGPTSAIQHLVDKLNGATAAGTYAFVDADAATGQVNALGTDAIKVGMLYKPARVTPVGQTAVLNSVAFVNGGDPVPRSRPSLAQAFQFLNGERFIVDANHLKSKSAASNPPCTGGDAGDGQADCNQVRVNAAAALVEWLAGDPTGTGDPDIMIVGDLNAYAMEDPITTIRNAGYTNLIATFVGPDAYSFLFDGQFGYLDHALATSSLTAQVSGVGEWHINADEPGVLDYNTDFKTANLISSLYAPNQFRMSDHDPLLVGLDLEASFAGLCNLVRQVVTNPDVVEGLCDKLAAAAAADERGNAKARDNVLKAFRNQVDAQTGKSISAADAAQLKSLAESL